MSNPLTDIYWDALKTLPIDQVEKAAKLCIRVNKHFPRPAEIFLLAREEQAAAPPSSNGFAKPPSQGKWLMAVNSLFLKYLLKRRVTESATNDINIAERRAECVMLAEFFEGLESENDPEATQSELEKRFHAMMVRVKDAPDDISPTLAKDLKKLVSSKAVA